MVKDNIRKLTDGLFRRCFEEAARHPEIESDVMIIDIGTAWIADTPARSTSWCSPTSTATSCPTPS